MNQKSQVRTKTRLPGHGSRVTTQESRVGLLRLPPHLRSIMEQEHPRCARAEYARRHKALADVMDKARVDHLLIVTENRSGNATQWVTGWPGTVEAYGVFKTEEHSGGVG